MNQDDCISTFRKLQVIVCEAKNLPAKDLIGTSDPYVILDIAGKQVRTKTIWNNNKNPFWGDEFEFEIKEEEYSEFDGITVSIWDQDHRFSRDNAIGSLFIPKHSLLDQKTHEEFLPVYPFSKDAYVSGKIKLSLSILGIPSTENDKIVRNKEEEGKGNRGKEEDKVGRSGEEERKGIRASLKNKIKKRKTSDLSPSYLLVLVERAKNLAAKDPNGLSDPFARVVFNKQKKKTRKIKETLNPIWNEEIRFNFEYGVDDVEVFLYDWDLIGGDDFLGYVKIPVCSIPRSPKKLEKWFVLESLETKSKVKRKKSMDEETEANIMSSPRCPIISSHSDGTIRLKIRYFEEVVLPMTYYENLQRLLLDDLGFLGSLNFLTAGVSLISSHMVAFFAKMNAIESLLDTLVTYELANTPDLGTIFRGLSIATKAIDAYMKLVGKKYLHDTMGKIIRDVHNQKKSCEINPGKLKDGEKLEDNLQHLEDIANRVINTIFSSATNCPKEMKRVFANISKRVQEKWGVDSRDDGCYIAITSFLFLRFFCPCILGPKLFGLLDDHPGEVDGRTFTLVAKILQNLANLVEFGQKEPFMHKMNTLITNNIDNMKRFLDELIETADEDVERSEITSEIEKINERKELASTYNFLRKNKKVLEEHLREQNSPFTEQFLKVVDEIEGSKTTFTRPDRANCIV